MNRLQEVDWTKYSRSDTHFGRCPHCELAPTGYINVERTHFMLCMPCKTGWCIGSNLFSTWRLSDERIKEKNMAMLKEQFRRVESLPGTSEPGPCTMNWLDPELWGEEAAYKYAEQT